jgi:hypothetical protein
MKQQQQLTPDTTQVHNTTPRICTEEIRNNPEINKPGETQQQQYRSGEEKTQQQ